MKALNRFILISFVSCFFNSCNAPVFSEDEVKFALPFSEPMTAIYEAETGLRDTIIYSKVEEYLHEYNNFEQGFYKERVLKVYYSLSDGSYHRFLDVSSDEKREALLLYTKASSHSIKEIYFLGMLFEMDYINSLDNFDSCYIFNEQNSIHNGININKRITSFQYCIKEGVTSYADNKGIKWVKVN